MIASPGGPMANDPLRVLLQRVYDVAPAGTDSWVEATFTLRTPTPDPGYPWDVQCDWSFRMGTDVLFTGVGHGGDDVDAVLNALWDARTTLQGLSSTHRIRWAGGEGLALPVGLVEYPPQP